MSRMSDDRTDLFKRDKTAMTSTSTIRNIHNLGTMDKDKLEKAPFGQHNFVTDSTFRNHELLKPLPKTQPTRIITATSTNTIQHHAIPPLLPNYITGPGHLVNTVPINHAPIIRSTIRSGAHAFQTHIPVGIGTASGLGSPRGVVTSQRSNLPSLKPTNLPSQIQLPINPISGLQTIIPPNISNRTCSPRVASSHVFTNEGRLDSRGNIVTAEPLIRGNIQANHTTPATIQVFATGTTPSQQTHLPSSTFINKNVNLASNTNMLKISVSSHSNANPSGGISISTFKLGLGKPFASSSNVFIPTTTTLNRADLQEVRQVVGSSPYNRFPVNPNISIGSHHIPKQTTPTTIAQPTVTISSVDSRQHAAVGIPYHPISTAYVFHDMGLHGFPHQLLRPAATSISSLQTFMPIVSIAVSASKATVQKNQENIRSEGGLTIQANANFNLQNLYPSLSNNVSVVSSSAIPSSTVALFESSVRPSILQRKRPADATTLFPVQPTEKERISSPLKLENGPINIPTKIFSPSSLLYDKTDGKSTNHSIISLTTDTKPVRSPSISSISHSIPINSKLPSSTTSFQTSVVGSLSTPSISEASPKKKPRKQSVVTTEDKYGATSSLNNSKNPDIATDADEEFLKSNETMKDITPPKSTTSVSTSSFVGKTSTMAVDQTVPPKQLFPTSSSALLSPLVKTKQENKELHLNGMLASLSTPLISDIKPDLEPAKIHIFRRKPRYSILQEYKINTKASHSHFIRQSDVKVKEDKRSLGIPESLLSKASIQAASGWKLHHLSDQVNSIINIEKEIREQLSTFRMELPAFRDASPSSYHNVASLKPEDKQLRLIHELLQGNIQRCNYSMEHLREAKETMFSVLEHRTMVIDFLKSSKTKPKLKKKHS